MRNEKWRKVYEADSRILDDLVGRGLFGYGLYSGVDVRATL